MNTFQKTLRRFFVQLDRLQSSFSERWREHSNRRTIIISSVIGAVAILLFAFVIRPPDDFPLQKMVSIPDGATLKETAGILQDQHVVRSALALRIIVALTGKQHIVQAGDYLFKEPLDIFAVARSVSTGSERLQPLHIRVNEGATMKDMAALFSRQLENFNSVRFLAQAPTLEGYLFPDTYYFRPTVDDVTITQTLQQKFATKIATINDQIEKFGRPLSDIVIMASILEREAPPGADRRIIAGILWKRIALGMPLQVDATFLYTLGKGTFQLTTKDLATDSPYNTYRNKGLPPGPIGSPSLDSLEAAVNPTKTDFLYFLADNNGVTHYSKTFEGQVANKRKYF